MHPIFSTSVEDVQSLNDAQARELVARLCRAELRALGESQAAVSWGGDQRAKDGGVDVRVDLEHPLKTNGYLKGGLVAFQVKAENFRPAKISPEMAPNNAVRPAIVELAGPRGAYVIVSTRDNLSDSSLNLRIEAMEGCLSSFGLKHGPLVDFYDARKIADWVELHPSVSNWMKHVTTKALSGWKPYGPWAYRETSIDAEYLIDDRVKVFAPDQDEGLAIGHAISQLRGDLSKNASVRIVGLSGVGKTRLAQALFDVRVATQSAPLDAENVIYCDLSDNPTPQPNAMLEALASLDADCVVVIDNCGPETHQRLTEIIKRPGSRLRLLTIEYDIRDDLPEGTIFYRLEGSSDKVITALLRRHYSFLSSADLERIVEFSDGNARVAFALASTASTTDEIGRLRDDQLFKRLFHQSNTENEELLRCAEVASLLYSFDGEDTSPKSELSLLASLAEVTVATFTRQISELQRRGLLQSRGPWRAVLPHAIANRLAGRALETIPPSTVVSALCDNATDRVARSFSRRLSYLHKSVAAQKIAKSWLSPPGRLDDLRSLNELGRQMFANIAPIDQLAALETIERAANDSAFVSVNNHDRSHFARIARSLAYEPALFDRAVKVLLKFAAAEPSHHNHDSARELLTSLFHVHLSGTQAPPNQRLKVVRELLHEQDQKLKEIGLRLLDATLKASHFSSIYGFDFGARKRDYGWWPKTIDDVHAWYIPFIDLSVEIGNGNDLALASQIRTDFGESVRDLITNAGMINPVFNAAQKLVSTRAWPEGWLGVRRILQWDKDKADADKLAEVRRLEEFLAPQNLSEKIVAKVMARGSFAHDFDDDEETADASTRFRSADKEAENLGRAAALKEGMLRELMPDLLNSESGSKVWNFGYGAGQESADVEDLLRLARDQVARSENRNFNLLFIRGLISGWHKTNPNGVSAFLDYALTDEIWGKWFPELQPRVDLDQIGFARIVRSIELGLAPTWQYKYLAMGRATDPLTIPQIITLVGHIAHMPQGGLAIAIDLMAMVIHCANEKDNGYRLELKKACITFLCDINWADYPDGNDHLDHDIEVILKFALADAEFTPAISQSLERLVERRRSKPNIYVRNRGKILAPYFKNFPTQALDAIYVPDSDGRYGAALQLVADPHRENSETAIRKVPSEALIAWCNVSPNDRYAFAAQVCALFNPNASEADNQKPTLSNTARDVLANAPNKKEILNIFVDRFRPRSWSGSLAAILETRLPILDELGATADVRLREDIARAKADLQKEIESWQKHEDREERARTGSFE